MACSEEEGIGTLDLEALFASSERVKWPEILAAGTKLNKKRRQIFLSSLLVFVFQRID
ncbi:MULTISPECIES: hypothetical protein [Bacillus cereus group]|uniref:hypothetical protein n=1 Tax=Bacillus cereus group TaxID=86661 RepID=UPI000B27E3DB|nr:MULTISPECIES: hypothetical protein [Bacillus cereus group]MDA1649315.1 hypothetical protein [Bacillus cereus group sp. TH160LC]